MAQNSFHNIDSGNQLSSFFSGTWHSDSFPLGSDQDVDVHVVQGMIRRVDPHPPPCSRFQESVSDENWRTKLEISFYGFKIPWNPRLSLIIVGQTYICCFRRKLCPKFGDWNLSEKWKFIPGLSGSSPSGSTRSWNSQGAQTSAPRIRATFSSIVCRRLIPKKGSHDHSGWKSFRENF
jgi:hypothetical protein